MKSIFEMDYGAFVYKSQKALHLCQMSQRFVISMQPKRDACSVQNRIIRAANSSQVIGCHRR